MTALPPPDEGTKKWRRDKQLTDSFTFSEDFTNVNNHVRFNWEMGRHAAKNVEKRLNELVALIHKEEPEWSINKIAQQIWVANEDLEGFTTKTIYNNLDESKYKCC